MGQWRTAGGGLLIAGGIFWILGVVTFLAGAASAGFWVTTIGIVAASVGIAALALLGAMGGKSWGRIAGIVAAVALAVTAVTGIVANTTGAQVVVVEVAANAVFVLTGALAIAAMRATPGVVGAAKWALVPPVLVALFAVLAGIGVPIPLGWWFPAAFGLAFAIAGVLCMTGRPRG